MSNKLELDENKKVPFNVHLDHHEWIHRQKTKEEIKAEEFKKIKTSLTISSIWATVLMFAGVIWYAIQHFVASGGK